MRIAIVAAVVCALSAMVEAQPSRVDPEQLCAVKDAIRFGQRAWTPDECERIATALNDTANPRQMEAVCTWESDLREKAQRVTVIADGRLARDIGLCAVRCVTDASIEDGGRCTNGAARGLYAFELLDPVVNIRTAAAVLASHGGNLNGFNGCVEKNGRRCRYGENIAALVSALGGVEVKVRGTRLRKLVKQVVEAIGKERRS